METLNIILVLECYHENSYQDHFWRLHHLQ